MKNSRKLSKLLLATLVASMITVPAAHAKPGAFYHCLESGWIYVSHRVAHVAHGTYYSRLTGKIYEPPMRDKIAVAIAATGALYLVYKAFCWMRPIRSLKTRSAIENAFTADNFWSSLKAEKKALVPSCKRKHGEKRLNMQSIIVDLGRFGPTKRGVSIPGVKVTKLEGCFDSIVCGNSDEEKAYLTAAKNMIAFRNKSADEKTEDEAKRLTIKVLRAYKGVKGVEKVYKASRKVRFDIPEGQGRGEGRDLEIETVQGKRPTSPSRITA